MSTTKMRETLPLLAIAAMPLILIGVASAVVTGLAFMLH
jgi:hypothetical protein